MGKLPYLNLGCGFTFHKDWHNIDFVSCSDQVQAFNLLDGIPHPDNSFSVVYHSHVLEHFPIAKAHDLIKECYRVLEKGGTIRIAIPDLEQIALNYIKYLNECISGEKDSDPKYNWTMLELFDQMIRTSTGGNMFNFILSAPKEINTFLLERNGKEITTIIKQFDEKPFHAKAAKKFHFSRFAKLPEFIKNKWIKLVLGKDYNAFCTGKFRGFGEIHQWMYDRYSLKRLLELHGFRNAIVRTAFESSIKNWSDFGLDSSNRVVRKPDSLFMEAIK